MLELNLIQIHGVTEREWWSQEGGKQRTTKTVVFFRAQRGGTMKTVQS